MPDGALDADELLRLLADAWRTASRSNEFPWDADMALQSSLRRLTGEMPAAVPLLVDTHDSPALLLVTTDSAALVRLTDRGAETIFLGELVGGTFRETEERIDARHSAITLRFEHERIPGGFVEHHAVSEQQRVCRSACGPCSAPGAQHRSVSRAPVDGRVRPRNRPPSALTSRRWARTPPA